MYVKVKPQDRMTWSKKWKHPSVAISQKALSYLPHSKAFNIDKNIKKFSKVQSQNLKNIQGKFLKVINLMKCN